MRPHVPDEALRADDVPAPGAAWPQIRTFGHTFHAYKVAGSLQRVAEVTLQVHDTWVEEGRLPAELTRLRMALFHTVRATGETPPDPATERWARALVDGIRSQLSG